ncbi:MULTISPECIES: trehalose-phosphatase [Micromonospora]|uniref:Trehalose 6-phosphate phosphatase n=2 Tax=Micromonospora TaxID=1873 RepID=A0ABX9Y5T3_MICCH|nr:MULTISPECIES: trehalose-phosphatase [Micromonospora]EWM65964.1 trehalose-phosphatase [Micromonospora sp. M42]MBP1780942.1 trehalose 6-phosphate phosphatase [Micromonospora sp. HB375]MBQ1061148.1 trehalose-phosphatase [Micromonospora sp. C41]MCK1808936.1 trehalose-phosphatase [Micromonospora sp. R42106]MCK1833445.1 trehalose-phosphatase [Micromonospora sp. R42003]
MPPLNLGNQQPKTPLNAEHAWRATADRARDVVLFFDFDGTLAPVDDDPTAVRPAPNVLTALEALAPHVRRIAIVSARPVDFLRDHLGGLAGIDLYGLYGLEHSHSGGETVTEPAALPWVPTMSELAEQARAELPPGALVEYKRLSVALHWRTAPQLGELVQEWGRAQAERLGLRAQPGRMVLELKPPVDRDKGMVIGETVRDAGGAWYFGDDVSDIKAFAALRARAAADPGFLGVCVAVANPETGHEVADAADLTLDSPAALAEFLTDALRHLT